MARFELILMLLNALLVFDATASNVTSKQTLIYRLSKNIIPSYYIIKLDMRDTYDFFMFNGIVKIIIAVNEPTEEIVFHNDNLTLDTHKTNLINIDNNKNLELILHTQYNQMQITVLTFKEELQRGNYILELHYSGKLNYDDDDLFRTTDPRGTKLRWLVVTQFKPIGARRLFPCWDDPVFRAIFDISVKHSRDYQVLSNMPVEEKKPSDEYGMIWTEFEVTPVLPTYLVVIAMTNLEPVTSPSFSPVLWGNKDINQHINFTIEVTQRIKIILDEYMMEMKFLNLLDLNLIVMPKEFKTIRAWGLIIFSEQSVILNSDNNNLQDQIDVVNAIAHEMIPMSFGDVVGFSQWDDEWINEGVAMCIQLHVLQEIFKTERIMDIFVVETLQEALHKNIYLSMHSVITCTDKKFQYNNQMYLLHQYTSDSILLRILQHIVTEEVFRQGIIKYLRDFKYTFVTADKFWDTMTNVLDYRTSQMYDVSISIKDVMTSWVKQSTYPVLTVSRDYNNGQIVISQEPFKCEMNTSCTVAKWIPVTIATQSFFDYSDTFPKYWLSPGTQNVIIDGYNKDDWILVNMQQVGYYRVNYDYTNWVRLSKVLNSVQYTNIHVLNRAQLIDDAYHLILENSIELSSDLFFDLVGYLKHEEDHIPWYSMARILEDISMFSSSTEGEYIKSRFLQILEHVVEKVGYNSHRTDSKSVEIIRSLVIYWACMFGHKGCLTTASEKLDAHLEDPTVHKIPPSQEYWTYCMGVKGGNRHTVTSMYYKYKKTGDKNFLKYMTCSKSYPILLFLMDLKKTDNILLPATMQDRKMIYNELRKKHMYDDGILYYLLMNFDEYGITHSRRQDTAKLIDIITNVCSATQIDLVKEFVINHIKLNISWVEIDVAIQTKVAEIEKKMNYGNRFKNPHFHKKYLWRHSRQGKTLESTESETIEEIFEE